MKQIVPNDNCLTQEQILHYLRDEISPDETRAIDRHLSRCPMCSDAIEGAMMLDSKDLEKAFLQSKAYILEKTNEEKLQKTALKVVRTPNRYLRYALSAAASLAVLVVAALWIFTKPLDNAASATAEAPPQYDSAMKAADSAYFEQKPIVLEDKKTEVNLNPPSSNSTEKSSTTKTENNIASVESNKVIDNQVVKSDDNLNMSTAAAPAPKKEAKEEAVASYSDNNGGSAKNKDRVDEKAAMEYSTQDRNFSKNKNAKSAAPSIESYKASPSSPTAAKAKRSESVEEMDYRVLNQGVKYFQEKEYDKAIGEFNNILTRQSAGDMYEKALWYSANAYFQKNSKPYSKAIYQRIVKEKGTFAAQAEVILKNWKE